MLPPNPQRCGFERCAPLGHAKFQSSHVDACASLDLYLGTGRNLGQRDIDIDEVSGA